MLSASFIPFFIISFLIIVHELGHFITAKILKVEVDKIYIYPLGGISKFFLPLNASFLKELLILIAGPLSQVLAALILKISMPEYNKLIISYHMGILIFNLLPIYPLDGGKLIHLLFSTTIPFEKSLRLSIIISYLTISIYFLINISSLNISVIIITIFLIYKVIQEQKQIKYIYEKFILERYLNNYNFKKSKLINNYKNFYKNKRHLIKENNEYYLEYEYLEKKYKKL